MGQISNTFCEAVYTLIDGKMSKLRFDKTVKATITRIVNLDTGEYKVEYGGNVFSAFASDTSKKYSINDTVLVMAPDGDFSNQKFILTKANGSSIVAEQISELSNQFVDISPTFDQLGYDYSDPGIGLIAGEHGVINIYNEESQTHDSQYFSANDNFAKYARKYEYIKIEASFLTQLLSQHTKGDYGIKVGFSTKDNSKDIVYKLGIDSFIGMPYSFSTYSPQSIIIQIQKGIVTGLKSIQFYEEGFDFDKDSKGEEIHTPNLFVKNIKLAFADKRDLYNTPYSLIISTPRGISFYDGVVSRLELTGQLIYQNQDLLDSNCSCQWYSRDLNLNSSSLYYDKIAGYGWKRLSGQTGRTLLINASEVKVSKEYKLVVIYNGITLSATVKIFNHDSTYDFRLSRSSDATTLELQKLSGLNPIKGDWYYTDPEGEYHYIASGTDQIDITPYLIYSSVIFYCQVYQTGEPDVILGIEEYAINSSTVSNDLEVIFNGESQFRYDANGDITFEAAEREYVIEPTLVWQEGIATTYSVSWSDSHGEQIPETPTSWKINSMIERVWVDNSDNLHYTIKQRYKANSTDNLFQFTVTTIDGKVYKFYKEILFLKDGDQGTNGTSYVMTVRPCTEQGDQISTFTALCASPRIDMYLRCQVYKDGAPLNTGITYKWTETNCSVIAGASTNKVTVSLSGSTYSEGKDCYIKAEATVVDAADNNKVIHLYAFCPLDVLVGNLFVKEDLNKFEIYNWPWYVKYTSSGVNPIYSNEKIDLRYDSERLILTPLDSELIDLKTEEDEQYLSPCSTFYFERYRTDKNRVAVFSSPISNKGTLYHTIIMYLDTYGNESINGWDGTALEIDKDGQYILSPWMGAGEKDADNKFTGIIMGRSGIQENLPAGLYGFNHGENTYGLMDDGTAFFGSKSGGGQIVLNGKSGTIYGGNVQVYGDTPRPAANSMYIQLVDKGTSIGSKKAIGIGLDTSGEEKFWVDYQGNMHAHGVNIDGHVQANEFWLGSKRVLFNDQNPDGVEISNLVIDAASVTNLTTTTIYSQSGDVADLTVDSLSTSRRIYRYLMGNYEEDNYTIIRDFRDGTSGIEFRTGKVEDSSVTVIAKNPNGQDLYWEDDIYAPDVKKGSTSDDGYPWKPVKEGPNEEVQYVRIYTTTKVTQWPVYTYQYTEAIKGSFKMQRGDQYYYPVITLGAGNQEGNNRAFISKPETGLEISYKDVFGNILGMKCNSGDSLQGIKGYTDIYGLRKTTKMDFSSWDDDHSFVETIDGEISVSYNVELDGEGRPILITDGNGHETQVIW